jgi:hypothetical protein
LEDEIFEDEYIIYNKSNVEESWQNFLARIRQTKGIFGLEKRQIRKMINDDMWLLFYLLLFYAYI